MYAVRKKKRRGTSLANRERGVARERSSMCIHMGKWRSGGLQVRKMEKSIGTAASMERGREKVPEVEKGRRMWVDYPSGS